MRVIAYTRVSTQEQASSGAGLEAQRRAIDLEAERRGWTVIQRFEDAGASGKSLAGRPGLQEAVEAVERGEGEALVVAKLDRLSRSLLDFASLMERARSREWSLVALDLGVDTSTPAGEAMASVLATFAQFERRLIGQRTKDALAVVRTNGSRSGRPIGNPAFRAASSVAVERILELRAEGRSFSGIAADLNAAGVPTAQGGQRWHARTVWNIVSRNS